MAQSCSGAPKLSEWRKQQKKIEVTGILVR
jgi:hypothetical protein